MLAGMSTNKEKSGPDKKGKPADRHVSPRVVFHLEQEVLDLLNEHIEESPVELKLSAVLRRAVKMYLESVGKWPPPTATPEGGKPRRT